MTDGPTDDELDLEYLGEYLVEQRYIGWDVGGRICIGQACGATFREAARKARIQHEEFLARQAERLALKRVTLIGMLGAVLREKVRHA